MPVTTLPIANGFYLSDSLPVSAQECRNWHPVIEDAPSLAQETLRGTPGLSQVALEGTSACRGSESLAGSPYFVLGDALYRLDADGTLTDVSGATSITGSGAVSMAENGTQIIIVVPGTAGYIYNGTTLAAITDTDFTTNGNPTAVVFIDGYFLLTTDDNKIIVSSLNDGTAYSALDFAGVESSTDAVVAPVVFRNQLFVGGTQTYEAFSNIGGSGFPFQRVNLFLTQGLSGRFAVQVTFDTFIWIGAGKNESPAVWTLQGNSTQKVSNRAVDSLLGGLTSEQLSAVTSWNYTQDGHFFVGFNLPTTTIVYDFSTQRWHQRSSRLDDGNGGFTKIPFRGVDVISAYGKLYCGDSQTGYVGELSLEAFDEYGTKIERVFSTPPVQNNMKPFSVPMVELTMESGVGSLTDEPQVEMERSRDGGFNFDAPRPRGFGKQGEYMRRAIWRRLGRADRYDMYRFTMSDAVKAVVMQLTVEISA